MYNEVNIHRYSNVFESRSASLHLYASPVDKWNLYAIDNINSTPNFEPVTYDKIITNY